MKKIVLFCVIITCVIGASAQFVPVKGIPVKRKQVPDSVRAHYVLGLGRTYEANSPWVKKGKFYENHYYTKLGADAMVRYTGDGEIYETEEPLLELPPAVMDRVKQTGRPYSDFTVIRKDQYKIYSAIINYMLYYFDEEGNILQNGKPWE